MARQPEDTPAAKTKAADDSVLIRELALLLEVVLAVFCIEPTERPRRHREGRSQHDVEVRVLRDHAALVRHPSRRLSDRRGRQGHGHRGQGKIRRPHLHRGLPLVPAG